MLRIKKGKKLPLKIRIISFLLVALVFYLVISIIHIQQYTYPDHTCRHMARDIEDALENIGISVQIIRADDGDNGHMWVKLLGVEFDSVTLLPSFNTIIYPQSREVFNDYQDYLVWRAELK